MVNVEKKNYKKNEILGLSLETLECIVSKNSRKIDFN